mmetsp:Transcript_24109/g.69349  ORF Transcript_24109/g.69349 Transcript_24109/m.69349 type:complete len:329 (-) Transcript_24109:30-1016(-)
MRRQSQLCFGHVGARLVVGRVQGRQRTHRHRSQAKAGSRHRQDPAEGRARWLYSGRQWREPHRGVITRSREGVRLGLERDRAAGPSERRWLRPRRGGGASRCRRGSAAEAAHGRRLGDRRQAARQISRCWRWRAERVEHDSLGARAGCRCRCGHGHRRGARPRSPKSREAGAPRAPGHGHGGRGRGCDGRLRERGVHIRRRQGGCCLWLRLERRCAGGRGIRQHGRADPPEHPRSEGRNVDGRRRPCLGGVGRRQSLHLGPGGGLRLRVGQRGGAHHRAPRGLRFAADPGPQERRQAHARMLRGRRRLRLGPRLDAPACEPPAQLRRP